MNNNMKNMTLTAMFLAIGMVLPIFTGQIPQLGSMLLPMHLPVFLCALICGWKYGLSMAFVLPILRSVVFGMPPLYPTALSMAFELSTYAVVAGLLYEKSRWQCIKALYCCLFTGNDCRPCSLGYRAECAFRHYREYVYLTGIHWWGALECCSWYPVAARTCSSHYGCAGPH